MLLAETLAIHLCQKISKNGFFLFVIYILVIIGDGSEAGGNNGTRNQIYYNGDIAQLALISEFWDDAKVLDHYNRTKSRFGLT